MSNLRKKKKKKQFTENRLEKKRITVAEQEKIRAKEERKKRQRANSVKVVRAVRKSSEPTYLTMVFSVILNLLLGSGFSLMLTSTYSLPVNVYVFVPLLLLLSLGISYCHAQKEKLTPFLLATMLTLLVWCFFMTDTLKINAQTRYAYSVLQQRVFHGWRPMIEGVEALRDRRRDITVLLLLLNFIPTFFTSLTIEKRLNILVSAIWYIPFLFCSTITSKMTPDGIPCLLAVSGILLLLIFQFVRRLGDSNTDKRMLIITAPVVLLCLLIGGLFPKEEYNKDKMAASHFEEVRGLMQDLRNRFMIRETPEGEDSEQDTSKYTGSILFDESETILSANAVEDLSKMGYFDPPDQKIMFISRYYNDTENHYVTSTTRLIYLRSTCMEVMDGNSWRTYTPSELKEPAYYYTEENASPQREADFVIRIKSYFPTDTFLVPSYTDHFFISEKSKYADLGIETHTFWNLQERVPSNGVTDYDYAFNLIPQKSTPEWNPDYLENEVYGVCLEVPEKTREGILKSKKIPSWYREVLDGTLTLTTSEKVYGVVQFVKNLHPYDPQTPYPPEGADFTSWFIMYAKSGFCVHYATTAAVLLRMIGVPTRYVTGYLTCSDLFVSGSEISMKDAHAWFEFFDPEYGWVLDDPTPGNAITAGHFNAYAIATEYGDMNYSFPATPSPTPSPTPTPTAAPVHGTIYGPTQSPTPTVTPVPESASVFPFTIPPAVLVILIVLLVIVAIIGLLRLLYILFWKLRFKSDSLNRRAIEYTRYFNMHQHILEAPDSRVVRSIFTKAEYCEDSISEEELAKLIRFGLHNLDKQISGRSVLRRMLSKILRVSL